MMIITIIITIIIIIIVIKYEPTGIGDVYYFPVHFLSYSLLPIEFLLSRPIGCCVNVCGDCVEASGLQGERQGGEERNSLLGELSLRCGCSSILCLYSLR